MVETANQFAKYIIFVYYVFMIPECCFVLHQAIILKEGNFYILMVGWFIYCIFVIIFITLSAGNVLDAATEPKETLHQFTSIEKNAKIKFQISIFLERFNCPKIGLSFLNFFVVTKSLLTNIASMILTYLLMILQFRQMMK
ncbi:uncharacterized protein LOC111622452 isoform X1 [Centruroides sculpturatus]|uniref:uncharacterized protein LOC111622452 isoform X1 n=1 Tax=Centruroides sculpturatus TaxID=218467 RepID=UPI000C6D601B|nr:uncharacterized protein LOC111622452 isoform X1 [Centruroides sculpturatus]